MGEHKPSVEDLDRAMGFILASVADGHVGEDKARRLIRAKGVIAAAKQIRKATRDARRQQSTASRDARRSELAGTDNRRKKRA